MVTVGAGLPRSTPSAQAVDARGVALFLDAVARDGLDLHSLMLVRNGHVVAEGWWAPYRDDLPHLVYSLSKSFTSTAIGMAEAEGLLSLDDKVVDLFPAKVPPGASVHLGEMKVRHLLAMASGHATDTRDAVVGNADGVAAFLAVPPEHAPGTFFCYNQGCTYTLSAIITKLTGLRLVDYLRPRLFEPLGVEPGPWSQTAEGVDQGWSGLHVTTEAVAKLGQLYLQRGLWEGRQLVPESYVAQATAPQVDNSASSEDADWRQGYGFQFWMCRHGAYRGDGAFGQFCVVVPEASAVMVCTAQVADMQRQLDLFWEHLLPAMSGRRPLGTGAENAEHDLAQRMAGLTAPVVTGAYWPGPGGRAVLGAGQLEAFIEGVDEVRLEPEGDGAALTFAGRSGESRFSLAPGRWAEGALPGLRLALPQVAVNGSWAAADRFRADIVSLTSPHRLLLTLELGDERRAEAEWQTAPL